jgi:GT2 family glycosyltransferase
MTVTAVMVNYKTARLAGALCGHLRGHPEISAVMVVDNSGEIEKTAIQGQFPGAKVLGMGANAGFGKGVNLGLMQAASEWALVINPDVRLEKNCISRLIEGADQFGAVLAGPRFYWDAAHQFRLPPATGDFLGMNAALQAAACFELDARLAKFYWQVRHERFWSAGEPFFEPFLSGACLLVHMPWVRKNGGLLFDERFFLYYEDTDLCARAVLDEAIPLCVPAAEAVHYYNQSPAPMGEKAAAMERSAQQFTEKYYPGQKGMEISGTARPFEIPDLGGITAPPVFDLEAEGPGSRLFFEIAMNPLFVPFVQCDAGPGRFYFPQTVWTRLAPGRYYSRIRSPYTNQEKVWQWEKRRP